MGSREANSFLMAAPVASIKALSLAATCSVPTVTGHSLAGFATNTDRPLFVGRADSARRHQIAAPG